MFYRVQAFCDLLDSRKEPFGFSIAPFSSAFSECRIDVFREDAGFGDTPHIPCVAHIFSTMPSDRSYNMRCYANPFSMVWGSPDISTMIDYSRKFPGEGAWKQAKAAPYDSLFPFRLVRRRNAPFQPIGNMPFPSVPSRTNLSSASRSMARMMQSSG